VATASFPATRQYENYVSRAARRSSGHAGCGPTMQRRLRPRNSFYLERLRHEHSRVNRVLLIEVAGRHADFRPQERDRGNIRVYSQSIPPHLQCRQCVPSHRFRMVSCSRSYVRRAIAGGKAIRSVTEESRIMKTVPTKKQKTHARTAAYRCAATLSRDDSL